MSSEDYLIRQFSQLAKVLAALMGFYEKKKYQLAIEEINQVLDTWFNLPDEYLENCSTEDLLQFVFDGNQELEKAKSIAELLYQKAFALRALEKDLNARPFAQKALVLFKQLDESGGDYSIEIQHKISELDKWRGADSLENY